MYRIRLASGEETVYRSVEELALGIQSGVITPEAQVYHRKTDRWLPIVHHPDYQSALNRDPLPARPSAAWEQLTELQISGEMGLQPSSPPVILQNWDAESRPTALRRRRALIVVGLVAVLAAAVGIPTLIRRSGPGPAPAPEPVTPSPTAPASTPPSATPTPASSRPAPGDTTHAPPTATGPTPPVASPSPTTADSAAKPAPMPPEQLIQALSAGYGTAAADFTAGLARVGLNQPLAAGRIALPDTVRAARKVVAEARKLITAYRARTSALDRAYRDTAQTQQKAGWTAQQAAAWNSRPILRETPEASRATDSLLTAADQLLELLADQAGRYEIANGLISFGDAGAADRYATLRARIGASTTAWADAPAAQVPPPLTALLSALASPLPDLVPKAPDLSPALPGAKADTAQ